MAAEDDGSKQPHGVLSRVCMVISYTYDMQHLMIHASHLRASTDVKILAGQGILKSVINPSHQCKTSLLGCQFFNVKFNRQYW